MIDTLTRESNDYHQLATEFLALSQWKFSEQFDHFKLDKSALFY